MTQVLGHHLSKDTTAMYRKAQSKAQWSVKVIPSVDDDEAQHKSARWRLQNNINDYLQGYVCCHFTCLAVCHCCRPVSMYPHGRPYCTSSFIASANVQEGYLAADRHMTGTTPRVASLPADLPPVEGLEPRLIQPGDYRKGLIAGQDMAVHATKPFGPQAVLGVYRCITITAGEEPDLKYNVPEAYPHCSAQWRQSVDMYAAEIAPPSQMTWGKRLVQTVFDEALQVCDCIEQQSSSAQIRAVVQNVFPKLTPAHQFSVLLPQCVLSTCKIRAVMLIFLLEVELSTLESFAVLCFRPLHGSLFRTQAMQGSGCISAQHDRQCSTALVLLLLKPHINQPLRTFAWLTHAP